MNTTYLYHHGIKGQRWGVRRYQNPDGSLTNAGRKRRYSDNEIKEARKNLEYSRQKFLKAKQDYDNTSISSKKYDNISKIYKQLEREYMNNLHISQIETGKEKVGKIVGSIGGIALTAITLYSITNNTSK